MQQPLRIKRRPHPSLNFAIIIAVFEYLQERTILDETSV
jgi:hypothetical protein